MLTTGGSWDAADDREGSHDPTRALHVTDGARPVGPAPGRRQYGKALAAVQALRDGAADTFDKAPGFNRALGDLAAAFEAHPQHRAWWCAPAPWSTPLPPAPGRASLLIAPFEAPAAPRLVALG
jgi:hypothetical protein